ncbi:Spo0B domain-containing protein [Desulfofalx alkaliphila]|uniref:Spo0B domain-containing protein n=1 Tax=Desulfofalx alkaliphila TaxID=105483 RepID=UPI000B2BF415|nr:Spo0B domain-containing protein [Desulfofalx alkaliphila]
MLVEINTGRVGQMKSKELLKIIQVQRHDFLNHLQVISGLVQLNKSDKVLEYIKKVSGEMGELAAITRLKIPELKAVLLIAINNCRKIQAEFVYQINPDLAQCTTAGSVLAQGVDECINLALEKLSSPGVEDRRILFTLDEDDAQYRFKFGLPGLSSGEVEGLAGELKYCRAQSFEIDLAMTAGQGEIQLTVAK